MTEVHLSTQAISLKATYHQQANYKFLEIVDRHNIYVSAQWGRLLNPKSARPLASQQKRLPLLKANMSGKVTRATSQSFANSDNNVTATRTLPNKRLNEQSMPYLYGRCESLTFLSRSKTAALNVHLVF